MTGHGDKLSRKQEDAIAALLTHSTICSAAKAIGIGEKTLYRWIRDEKFARAYKEARNRAVEDAVDGLRHLTKDALAALGRNMECGIPSTEVAAARVVFDHVSKLIERTVRAEVTGKDGAPIAGAKTVIYLPDNGRMPEEGGDG